ncbi:MAG: hypothetical protein ABW128_13155 [Rhizorhabdus sp.]
MAYGQADIDALETAMGSGALKVRYADGSEVTYRSLDEMERLLSRMRGQVAPAATVGRRRRYPAYRNGC